MFRIYGDKAPEISSSVMSGQCPGISISMTPTTGVDPSGTARAEGLIGMLKRCTRAKMLG